MKLSQILSTSYITFLLLLTFSTFASVAPQMVKLNLQIKGKSKILKSDLSMPFYQTAQLEKTIDNKNYLIEVSPKMNALTNEIDVELKFLNKATSKIIAKKEIHAKLDHESVVSFKGMTFRITPTI